MYKEFEYRTILFHRYIFIHIFKAKGKTILVLQWCVKKQTTVCWWSLFSGGKYVSGLSCSKFNWLEIIGPRCFFGFANIAKSPLFCRKNQWNSW